MNYASISIDRREAYYARCAPMIAADPLGFYARAEKGREIQMHKIKPKDLQPFRPVEAAAAPVLSLAWNRDAKNRAA